MDENKLKHEFVKKEKQLDTNVSIRPTSIDPFETVHDTNSYYETIPRPEIPTVEEVIVERVLNPEILTAYGNHREELISTIKQDMAKKLGSLLLESGYVTVVESVIPENFDIKIKMMVKVKKQIQ